MIKVSNLFKDIYENFNVFVQNEKMKQLSRKELLLMIILSIDSFSEDNPVVLENWKAFKTEMQLIHDCLPNLAGNDEVVITDEDLILLGSETGDKFIDVTQITDMEDGKLPSPLSETEALIKRRNIGIEIIIK